MGYPKVRRGGGGQGGGGGFPLWWLFSALEGPGRLPSSSLKLGTRNWGGVFPKSNFKQKRASSF